MILALIQEYPYVLNRNILVEIFHNPLIQNIVDILLDYYLLFEVDRLFWNPSLLQCRSRIYIRYLSAFQRFFERILRLILSQSFKGKSVDMYTLYVLSQNNLILHEMIEYKLYYLIRQGFSKTVKSFIDVEYLSVITLFATELWR